MTELTISPEYEAATLTASSIIEKHENQTKGDSTPDPFWRSSEISLLTGIIVYVIDKTRKNELTGSPQDIYDIFESKETCHAKVVAICNEVIENSENPRLVDIAKMYLGLHEVAQQSIAQSISSALETKEEGMWRLLSQKALKE